MIRSNPAEGLMTFSAKAAKRGVLTDVEVQELFSKRWPNERCKIANMLAMSTGLRAGEIVALQVRDIGDNRLFIRHSWNDWDKLKGTKTEAERTVPVLAAMRTALLDIARRNPNGIGPNSFVFWSSTSTRRPMQPERLLRALSAALLQLRLTDEELKDPTKVQFAHQYWAGRHVVFHSWRHFFASRMADRLEKRKVMLATGHANGAVFDAYADHGNEEIFREVEKAAGEAFAKLLHF